MFLNFLKKIEKILKKVLTNNFYCDIIITVAQDRIKWKHSSVGRASALQAEGHRFEPYCFHQSGYNRIRFNIRRCSSVGYSASLSRWRSRVRAPLPSPTYASVAQLVEQGTENPRVVGSIPTGGTIINADLAHLVERNLAKVEVAGSSPVIRSSKATSSTDVALIT